MKLVNLYRVLAAAHISYSIDGVPDAFSQRGGIILVAPPEQLKTTSVQCLSGYGDCLLLSDLNVQQLAKHVRDEIASGRYRTLGITSFEKLYKRNQDTAANLEAHLAAMTEEGFTHATFEDSRSFVRTAKCLVVGALVESCYKRKISDWLDSGFARRFLWSHFRLKDSLAVSKAIINWSPITIKTNGGLPSLAYGPIPWNVTQKELKWLHEHLLEWKQPGKSTPLVLSAKIVCVLKWYFRDEKNPSLEAIRVFADFGESLNLAGGAELEFEE